MKTQMRTITAKEATKRLNQIDVEAENHHGSPKQLYDKALATIKAVGNDAAREDGLQELGDYLMVPKATSPMMGWIKGHVYHFEDDGYRLANDADICDDLDEVYEFFRDNLV